MRRIAFLVGSSIFQADSGLTNLSFPPSDVEALAAVLRDPSIGRYDLVKALIEPTKDEILTSLADLLDNERGAFVLFYYSGHGLVSDSGRLFLAATNTTERLLPANGVSVASIFEMKDDFGCGRFCAILDCCYAGLGFPNIKGSEDEQLKAFAEGKGIFFLGAASSTVAAREDPALGHGILTAGIVEGLQSGLADIDDDGRVSGPDLFAWCRDFAAKRGSQRPVQSNQVVDDDLTVAFAPRRYLRRPPVARPRQMLKSGDTFAVFDDVGDIGVAASTIDGLFHRETRFLSYLELLINGSPPFLFGSDIREDNTIFVADLANPEFYESGRVALQPGSLHISRTTFLWRATLYQRLAIRNHGEKPAEIEVTIRFDNYFTEISELRGQRRPHRGTAHDWVIETDTASLRYVGLDGETQTILEFKPTPSKLIKSSATYSFVLSPGESTPIFVSVSCLESGIIMRPMPFLRALLSAHRGIRQTTRDIATVESSNHLFNEVLCRSAADLQMLITETPQGLYPYAAMPWHSTTTSRDGIITAIEMLCFCPRIARGVLRRLAAYQATSTDPASGAEPGKILHEMRGGEMARGVDYGGVDSTPLFVLLAGLYFERTEDEKTLSELWPAIEAALAWIDGPGDRDRDGFVEYYRQTDKGLANQGWKDSHDAIFHADGRMATGSIALAEVQGYVFAAKQLAARCAARLGHAELACKLEAEAARLAERFEDAFWCPEIETYALALDGDKEPCRVRTSNAGQVLFSGIARDDRASLVADGLINPRFFSGWGIRTVARGEARYNPMSYHNGSIWPHDNALIALGLARYGLKHRVAQITRGLFEAATCLELRRLPELICGYQRERRRGPTLYPAACSPRSAASAAPFQMVQACLGLEFDRSRNEVRLRNPHLPSFLDEVIVRNLSLGDSRMDLRVQRNGGGVSLEVLHTSGRIQATVISSSAMLYS